jgi:hypothetical protein
MFTLRVTQQARRVHATLAAQVTAADESLATPFSAAASVKVSAPSSAPEARGELLLEVFVFFRVQVFVAFAEFRERRVEFARFSVERVEFRFLGFPESRRGFARGIRIRPLRDGFAGAAPLCHRRAFVAEQTVVRPTGQTILVTV